MAVVPTFTCEKCKRTLDADAFYTYKDGNKVELCKKCLTMHIDNFDESTFLWLLEKMDVPYIPEEWNVLRDRAYAKNPNKMNGMSVFGKYLSKMKLRQWKNTCWADGERLRKEREEKDALAAKERTNYEQSIKQQYDEGKINEAQYRTLVSSMKQHKDDPVYIPEMPPETNFISEEELSGSDPSKELTKEDRVYLAMKWGRFYRPNEWLQLERKYTEMTNCFDIEDSDSISTLILICKTDLKMNQMLDSGDIDGYNKLARTYDTLRKSAKFTAVQNKKEDSNFIDTVGELVAYCEREKGQIPEFEINTAKDIIDKEIDDLKSYTKSLIYKDTSIAQQIESYLKQRQMMEENKQAIAQGREIPIITNDDYSEYFDQIAQEKEDDKRIYEGESDE